MPDAMAVMAAEIVPLGTIVKPWGRVAAVGFTGGERYYWLIDEHETVSMMPASVVEPRYKEARNA